MLWSNVSRMPFKSERKLRYVLVSEVLCRKTEDIAGRLQAVTR
jgi:hypothetical protein